MKEDKAKDRLSVAAVIPSAGIGSRMGYKKKNYLRLLRRPVLAHALAAFEGCPVVTSIILVVPHADVEYARVNIVERYGFTKVAAVVAGGTERQHSVANGIKAASVFAPGVIIVHDGARPLVTEGMIEETVRAAMSCGAAICAVPVKDTIKESSAGYVTATVPREALRSVQTPQAFRTDIILEAHRKALEDGFVGTDESSLVERLGVKVRIVGGSYENIKITTPEDLAVALCILRARAKAG
ncbi:MAG: 2-C-methyl-D-erythritol 4-phosphate cytidylyltransferase [Deltaproteobacteria bacterium]|nr:2-C-methyl-D-erythritol 4-phosphate cytidylyltransferase [Deltaproteobacteria bacterium]